MQQQSVREVRVKKMDKHVVQLQIQPYSRPSNPEGHERKRNDEKQTPSKEQMGQKNETATNFDRSQKLETFGRPNPAMT